MITKRRELGFWIFEIACDQVGCPTVQEFEDVDFHETVDRAKNLGWKIKKTVDSYEHYCPGCTGVQ